MAKLALALDGEWGNRLLIDRQTSRAAARALGEVVLLYRPLGEGLALYEATARLRGVEITTDGRFACVLRDVVRLGTPQTRPRPDTRRSGAMLQLPVEDFDGIVRAGLVAPAPPEAGLLEAAQTFEGPVRDPTPVRVYRQVLEAYGFRCAVTGEQFEPGESPHPRLRLLFLKPRQQGGPLHVRNLMPMVEAAHAAWTRGTLSATADHRVVTVIRDLDLALFDRIEQIGRLHLPEDERYQPDPAWLGYHFEQIFGR